MKVKVAEASGRVLDYMVAVAAGHNIVWDSIAHWVDIDDTSKLIGPGWKSLGKPCGWSPSTHGGDGMPIIEQLRSDSAYQFLIESDGDNVHVLSWPSEHVHFSGYGPTILTAAMRCLVASRLGEEVEVPDELLKT